MGTVGDLDKLSKTDEELLQKYSKDVIKVDLGTDAIFNDVDTPDVYQEIMDKLLV